MDFKLQNPKPMLKPVQQCGKDNKLISQEQMMFEYLINHIATASMVSYALKIPQKNITRFKRRFECEGKLWTVKHEKCKITGFKAWYLTTNPLLIQKQINNQLSLFSHE